MKAGLALAASLLVPGLAAAQPAARTWSELRPAGWSTVYVLDHAGVETTGRLLRTDRDSLVLLVRGRGVRIDAARIERIQNEELAPQRRHHRGARRRRCRARGVPHGGLPGRPRLVPGLSRCRAGRLDGCVRRDRRGHRRPGHGPHHRLRGADRTVSCRRGPA